jgi:hypothetical protein
MRNKLFATFWAFVGAATGFYLGLIPAVIIAKATERVLGLSMDVAGPIALLTALIVAFGGARWLTHLFYIGELWGHKPDGNGQGKRS